MMRRLPLLISLVFLASPLSVLHAQSTNARVTGRITDPSKALIAGAKVAAVSSVTDARYETTSNGAGEYYFPNLSPGPYRIEVEKAGFKKLIKPDVVLHVQDVLEMNFELPIGSASDSITVEAGAPLVNTSDASVNTVIDNRFVENMPLNGRSFSSLIELTPGVVLTPINFSEHGQLSVNGQRPDANYFMVDGASANLGDAGNGAILGQGGAGQLPATSAFGGTSNLVSLDALQEFRIQTSTFAPEFGRTPGAQISVVTKSGTNAFHGTAFEYFRNDVLDANNWFANHQGLRKPELRQNDFGGVLGGPIKKDKLFFFGSYEGLRVRQPQVANTYVPTLATRQNAPAVVKPLLNAFPLPNGADLGNGTAQFLKGYSDPSTLNAANIRIDYLPTSKISLFGRYNHAPSTLDQRGGGARQTAYNNIQHLNYRFQSLTLGSDQAITARWTNELRFNYSRNRGDSFFTLDNFGGATVPADSVLYPYSFAPAGTTSFAFFGDFNPFGLKFLTGAFANNLQQQINITDSASHSVGGHQLKVGIDYRRLTPLTGAAPYQVQYQFGSLANILANKAPTASTNTNIDQELRFSNWSLFAQDTWKVTHTFTVTYGLRWDYNAAPTSSSKTPVLTVNQVKDLSMTTLAPLGTPLWHPQKDDFAPRLGIAWQALPNLVVRAGAGIFYDLGYSTLANGTVGFPYDLTAIIRNASFPLSPAAAAPLPFTTSPPVSALTVIDPDHVLPRTYEWNAAVEQGLGKADVLTLSYIGAGGRKLMRRDVFIAPNPQFTGPGELDVLSNGGTSSYNALQAQYRHRLSHGLQTLVYYTWAHSIDDVSTDGNFQNAPLSKSRASAERGPSDYDIRHTFSGAVSYDIPGPGSGVLKQVFGNWSTDSIIYLRSAPPVNVVTGKNPFGSASAVLSGASSAQRPNVVSGAPFYLSASGQPCGRVINPAAFTIPASGQGDLGRNALRGCNAVQFDTTLRRQFRLTERFALHARADFFNIFNHPNFGSPINFLSSPLFGQSTQMLSNYLGSGGQSGGLNPLYQIGGPRSIQLALKLQF